MKNGRIVYSSQGSLNHLSIPAGQSYYIVAQDIPGYTLYKSLTSTFEAWEGKSIEAELYYQRDIGYIKIQGTWPSDLPLEFTLNPQDQNQPPLSQKILQKNGWITWNSGPLPTGAYSIQYNVPTVGSSQQLPPIIVSKGQSTLLIPPVPLTSSLKISTNTSQAFFTLSNQQGEIIGQGQGLNYTFNQLTPNTYTITYTSSDPQSFTPPAPQKIIINANAPNQLQVNYLKTGRLIVSSNVAKFTILIHPYDRTRKEYRERITNRNQTLYLPEGRYKISYEPIDSNEASIPPQEVDIRMFSTKSIYYALTKQMNYLANLPCLLLPILLISKKRKILLRMINLLETRKRMFFYMYLRELLL